MHPHIRSGVFVAILLIPFMVNAQTKPDFYTGRLLSAEDSSAVENAFVQIGDSIVYSDKNGAFQFYSFPSSKIKIRRPGFESFNLRTSSLKSNFVVCLKPNTQLEEVGIVYRQSFTFNGVYDFIWLENRLLVSSFKGRKDYLELRENNGSFHKLSVIVDTIAFNGFYTDCMKRVFGRKGNYVYMILLENDSIRIGTKYLLSDFDLFRSTCIIRDSVQDLQLNRFDLDRVDGVQYMSQQGQDPDRILYTSVIPDSIHVIKRIISEELSANLNNGYYSKDIWWTRIGRSVEPFNIKHFAKYNKAPKVYVPAFSVKGKWCIFDHLQDQVAICEPRSNEILEIAPISYHQEKNWSKEIIQSVEGELYIKYETKGGKTYLQYFDIESLSPKGKRIELKHNFPKKILISDHKAVYTYKVVDGYFNLGVEAFEIP